MLQVVALQLLCAGVAVLLSHLMMGRVAEIYTVSVYELKCGEVWARLCRMPTAKSGADVPIELYRWGDTDTEPYRRNMHLWVAAFIGVCAPRLDLGRNPFGLAGLVLLAALFSHMATIDMGEFRIPNGLNQLAALTALGTVVASGYLGGYPQGRLLLIQALMGGTLLAAVYFGMQKLSPNKLGYGDVQLSISVGLLLGWAGLPIVAYGFTAAWLLQGLVSLALLQVKITSRKALLPFGPSIIFAAVMTPQFFS